MQMYTLRSAVLQVRATLVARSSGAHGAHGAATSPTETTESESPVEKARSEDFFWFSIAGKS